MKKHFSSLVVLTLFLNSFTVFAMKKQEQKHSEFDYKKLYNNVRHLIPEHLTTWKILPFLNAESLQNIKNTNKFFKERVSDYVVFVDLRDLQSRHKLLISRSLNFEKIKSNTLKLNEKIKKCNHERFLFIDVDNTSTIRILNRDNFRDVFFRILKCRDTTISKIVDNPVTAFGTRSLIPFTISNPLLAALLALLIGYPIRAFIDLTGLGETVDNSKILFWTLFFTLLTPTMKLFQLIDDNYRPYDLIEDFLERRRETVLKYLKRKKRKNNNKLKKIINNKQK